MSYLEHIKNNTLLVIPNVIKEEVIYEITCERLLTDIKYISLDELRRKILFDYDDKALHYLSNTYGYKIDVSKMYLDNMVYVEDMDYSDFRLNKLVELKREIINKKLNIVSEISEYCNRHIVIYGYNYIDNFDLKWLRNIDSNVEILKDTESKYKHDNIYEFYTIEKEVEYVFECFASLIESGININNIKIMGLGKDYYNIVRRYSYLYNIPVNIPNDISLYSTSIGKYFIDNIKEVDVIEKIKDSFNLKNEVNVEIYNEIINICNKYVEFTSLYEVKDLIVRDLKNTKLKDKELKNSIKLISFNNSVDEEDYIFILGFNYGSIPIIYKDEEYLTDKIKEGLGLITSIDKNKIEKENIVNKINNIKNLTIAYKLKNNTESYIISNLNDKLNLKIIGEEILNYKYSDKLNKIKLASCLDKLVKFGIKDKDLSKLYSHYIDIEYLKYDNKYQNIDKEEFCDFIDNKLLLSYSSIDNYYRCGFRYYLNNILRLSPYEETYATVLGNLFHEVLSKAFSDKFNLEKEHNAFLEKQTYEFNNKERFFINKAKEELRFIIETIKKQYEHIGLTESLYEEKIYVDKSTNIKVTFMGIIDKLLYKESGNKTIVCIIDYKTGNPVLNINNTIYGIEMQLPVYLYLSKNTNKLNNVEVAGFYLQKVLNNEIKKDYKHTYIYLKEDNLKLQGYSNSNTDILEMFDDSYESSLIVKSLGMNSKGFNHYSKVIDNEKIDKLVDIVDKKIEEARDNILDVKFDINPKRVGKDNIGCLYCEYKDICYMEEKDIIELKKYDRAEFLGGEEDA